MSLSFFVTNNHLFSLNLIVPVVFIEELHVISRACDPIFYQLSHFVIVNVKLVSLHCYIDLNIGFTVVLEVREQP